MIKDFIERLKAIGFAPAGCWRYDAGRLVFELNGTATARNFLCAFVVDGALAYIGKSVLTLRERMSGYKNPGPTQPTNKRNHAEIRRCLDRGLKVEIWVLPDSGLLHYGGFHVNLAASLEDSVVRELRPPWNGIRTRVTIAKKDQTAATAEE